VPLFILAENEDDPQIEARSKAKKKVKKTCLIALENLIVAKLPENRMCLNSRERSPVSNSQDLCCECSSLALAKISCEACRPVVSTFFIKDKVS